MRQKNRTTRTLVVVPSVVIALAVGIAGGAAAVSAVPTLMAPDGVRAAEGVPSTPQPAPEYNTNSSGETYGSALIAISPESEPDLILAVATNGTVGYLRKTELDIATGAVAAESFASPGDALRWQNTVGAQDRTLDVYAKDGITVVGRFVVAGEATQSRLAAADGPAK